MLKIQMLESIVSNEAEESQEPQQNGQTLRLGGTSTSRYQIMEANKEFEDLTEDNQFIVDDVSKIIKEAIENSIENVYQHDKVNKWNAAVMESCLGQLTKLQRPYKYIVTCAIMPKGGSGLHTASSCFWDNNTDGSCTVRWENKAMYCIVSVFGIGI